MAASSLAFKFPEDLMLDILCRVPVKLLCKFKCVNKSWFSLVSNPCFIQLHWNYWSKLKKYDDMTMTMIGYNVESEVRIKLLGSKNWENTGIWIPGVYNLKIIGGAKGLICLTYMNCHLPHGAEFMLMNPAIRERLIICKDLPSESNPKKLQFMSAGFGYSHKHYGFKIVRVEGLFSMGRYIPEINIYSLSTGTWKKIETEVNLRLSSEHMGVQSGESLYWKPNDGKEIVVFSLSSEKFYTISLPGSEDLICMAVMYLKPDSIRACIMDPRNRDNCQGFSFWRASPKENPEAGIYDYSWTKDRNLTKSEWAEINETTRAMFNPRFLQRMNLKNLFRGSKRHLNPCGCVLDHMESLVSLKHVVTVDFEEDVANGAEEISKCFDPLKIYCEKEKLPLQNSSLLSTGDEPNCSESV